MYKKYFNCIRVLLFLFVFFLASSQVIAQQTYILKGVVKDSITDKPLSSVTIKTADGSVTFLSRKNGTFQLPVKNEIVKVHLSYMGYSDKFVTINIGNEKEVTILLSQKSLELEEVVTSYAKKKYQKKNNPAIDLVKKVIDRKDELRSESQPFYQCEKYERISLALNDFSSKTKIKGYDFLHNYTDTSRVTGKPVLWLSVKERLSDVYYRKDPKNNKEIVKGIHRIGIDEAFNQEGIDAILSELFMNIDVFDNDINYLMTRFVSPLSTFATTFYKYYIVDTVQINNKPYIDLEFVPFNTQSIGFTGHLFIANDSTYSIKKIQMDVPKDIQLNYVERLYIEQEFEEQKNGAWMLSKESMIVDFQLFSFVNGLYAEINRNYSDFSFNEARKEVYSLPTAISISPLAEQYSEALWETHRQKNMSGKERELSDMMDQMKQKKLFNIAEVLLNVITTGYFPTRMGDKNKIELGRINSLVSFNKVEDWRFKLDFRTTVNFHDQWYFAGYGAYGLKDEKFKYYGDVRYSFNKRKTYINEFPMNNVGISYKYDLESPGQFSLMTNRDNIFMSINRNENDKMTYVKELNAFYEKEFLNNFSFKLWGEYRNDAPTGNLHYQKLYENELIDVKDMTTTTLGVELRYAPGQKFYQDKGKRMRVSLDNPVFTLTQKIGLKDVFGSDHHIYSTELSAKKRFWLSAFGNITAELNAGKVWNEAPFPLLFSPNANTSYFLNGSMAFSMMNTMEFINDQYASLFLTYNANGWIFNRIPLLKKLKLREVVSFRSFWGSLSDKNNPEKNPDVFLFPTDLEGNTTSFKMGKSPYVEMTFGIENIFRLFRIDYIRRLNYLGYPNIDKHGWQVGLNITF